MKKIIILIAQIVSIQNGYSQIREPILITALSENILLQGYPDSIIYFKTSETTSLWNPETRYIYYYDSAGNKTAEEQALWKDYNWQTAYRIEYLYQNEHLINKTNLWWDWYYNEWANVWQYSFEYDSSSQLADILFQEWSEADLIWNNDSLQFFEYNSSGQLLFHNIQLWSTYFNLWENDKQTASYYDSSGKINEQIESLWEFDLQIWEPDKKRSYDYDSMNFLIEELQYQRVFSPTAWINDQKKEYTYYENGNIKDRTQYIWINFNNQEYWLGDYKYTYFYDEDGNISEKREYLLEWDLLIWENFVSTVYEYNSNGQVSKVSRFLWENNQWKAYEKLLYYYDGFNNTPWVSKNHFKIYPQPASEKITIELEEKLKNVRLNILDFQGKNVYSSELETVDVKTEIILPVLTNGIYMIQLHNENLLITKKLIINGSNQ